jgi:bifunctional DNase/RNase
MNKDVVEVRLRAVLPLDGSFAVFLTAPEKTMVIYVDDAVGTAISLFMRGVAKERPLTHDLMGSLLMAFGAGVQRVVINEIEGSVFRARLILEAANELHARKVIELDARPSDCIAMALQQEAPIYVARAVLDEVRDESDLLSKIEQRDIESLLASSSTDEGASATAESAVGDSDEEDDFTDLDDLDDEDDDLFDGEDDDEDEDEDEEGEEWKRADD